MESDWLALLFQGTGFLTSLYSIQCHVSMSITQMLAFAFFTYRVDILMGMVVMQQWQTIVLSFSMRSVCETAGQEMILAFPKLPKENDFVFSVMLIMLKNSLRALGESRICIFIYSPSLSFFFYPTLSLLKTTHKNP